MAASSTSSASSRPPLVAVLDLGKSNKKVVLVDDRLGIVASRSAAFPATLTADGILVEQVDAIFAWFLAQLRELGREYPIAALAVSTHGATIACLAADGRPAVPVVAYETDLGEAASRDLDAEFYRQCGPLERLQDETGTCDLPLLINPAKQILFLQRRFPRDWARTTTILTYPSYWGWRFTGQRAAEPTYTFNHSFLHDIRTRRPSSAAVKLGCVPHLDLPMRRPWDRLGTLSAEVQAATGLGPLPVAVGIHDSNAALLPYLLTRGDRDFCLNSTGTWCVAMHRVKHVHYGKGELGQKIIFNVDALGSLVKTSFLMGGMDYQLYHGLIGGGDPGCDAARLAAALARTGDAILPGAFASQFPRCAGGALVDGAVVPLTELKTGARPGFLADPTLAHDLLNVSLALQSEVAIRRTGVKDGTAIFIEGGFRQNAAFLAVLAALFPQNPIACTSLAEATACGTALLGHALVAGCEPQALADRIVIDEIPVARVELPGLAAYRAAWLKAAG